MAVAVRREGGGRAFGPRRATTVCMAVAPTPVAVSVAPVAVSVAVAPKDEQPNEVDAQTHSTHDQQLIQVLPQVVLDLRQVSGRMGGGVDAGTRLAKGSRSGGEGSRLRWWLASAARRKVQGCSGPLTRIGAVRPTR